MQINAARDYGEGSMRHIVLLRFANDVPESEREGMIERFLRLKDDCQRYPRPDSAASIWAAGKRRLARCLRSKAHSSLTFFPAHGDAPAGLTRSR